MRVGNKRARARVSSRMRSVFAVLPLVVLLACDKKNESPPAPAPSAAPSALPKPIASASARIERVEIPEVHVRKSAPTTVNVKWITPKGTEVNDEAPFRVRWNRSDGLADAPNDVKSSGSAVKDGFSLKVQPMPGAPNATLAGEIDIVVCDSVSHSVCVPVRRSVELGFLAKDGAPETAGVSIPLPEARSGH